MKENSLFETGAGAEDEEHGQLMQRQVNELGIIGSYLLSF